MHAWVYTAGAAASKRGPRARAIDVMHCRMGRISRSVKGVDCHLCSRGGRTSSAYCPSRMPGPMESATVAKSSYAMRRFFFPYIPSAVLVCCKMGIDHSPRSTAHSSAMVQIALQAAFCTILFFSTMRDRMPLKTALSWFFAPLCGDFFGWQVRFAEGRPELAGFQRDACVAFLGGSQHVFDHVFHEGHELIGLHFHELHETVADVLPDFVVRILGQGKESLEVDARERVPPEFRLWRSELGHEPGHEEVEGPVSQSTHGLFEFRWSIFAELVDGVEGPCAGFLVFCVEHFAEVAEQFRPVRHPSTCDDGRGGRGGGLSYGACFGVQAWQQHAFDVFHGLCIHFLHASFQVVFEQQSRALSHVARLVVGGGEDVGQIPRKLGLRAALLQLDQGLGLVSLWTLRLGQHPAHLRGAVCARRPSCAHRRSNGAGEIRPPCPRPSPFRKGIAIPFEPHPVSGGDGSLPSFPVEKRGGISPPPNPLPRFPVPRDRDQGR
eukprot:scaffold1821_cov344-Pavlova_lutheri.AAC.13